MLEMLINPQKAERQPWEMFFIGLFYASISLLLVSWIFGQDPVLSKYTGVLMVTFTVLFSIPFIYYTIKLEETKILPGMGTIALLKEHRRAIYAFLWLFMGFIVAFSFWYIVLPSNQNFSAQIQTYCSINRPGNFDSCVDQYMKGLGSNVSKVTGHITSTEKFLSIFSNNMYVLLFTLLFSLILGAGAIFILAWNATVIAAAIGIFTKSDLASLPMGLLRYMIHGIPEIGSYFIVALAGGMVSIAVIKHEAGTTKFWDILQDSLNLILVAVGVLVIAAAIEVYLTPIFF